MKTTLQNLRIVLLLMIILIGRSEIVQAGWSPVGTAGFSPAAVETPQIAIDTANGIPYIAFIDADNYERLTVMKYNGLLWDTVGSRGISTGSASAISFIIDRNGTPYIGYLDNYVWGQQVCVKMFDGTNWLKLGATEYVSVGESNFVSIATDTNGTPYVAYTEPDYPADNRINVQKFDGINWVTVGASNFSNADAYHGSISIGIDQNPYVGYADASYNQKACVKKFDGSIWANVGPEGFTADAAFSTIIRIDNSGTPYLSFSDQDVSGYASVMKFDGSDWVFVGDQGFSEGSTYYNWMELDATGTPYVIFSDAEANYGATVMKFNGTEWTTSGCPNISNGSNVQASIAIDKNQVPYIAFADDNNNFKATVMKIIPSTFAINTHPIDQSVCSNLYSFTISVNTSGDPSYQWQEDDGSGYVNLSNSWLNSGVYTNTLTLNYPAYRGIDGYHYRCVFSGCDLDSVYYSDAADITLLTGPAILESPESVTLCGMDSVASFITIVDDSNLTYQWQVYSVITWEWENISDDNTYTGTNTSNLTVSSPDPSHEYYEFNLIITDSIGCITEAYLELDFDPSPEISANASETSICSGNTVTLWGEDGNEFSWSNGIYNNVPFSVTTSNTYVLSGMSWRGCLATDTILVDVFTNPLAIPTVTAGGPLTICEGDSITLTANNTSSGFMWSTGQGTPSITVTKSGNYYVENSDNQGCQTNSTPIEIYAPTLPKAITYGDCNGNWITGSSKSYTIPKDYDPENTCLDGRYIDNFTFAGINNLSSGCSNTTEEAYSFFPTQMATVIQGETYPFTISPSMTIGNAQVFGIWIDFNKNENFNDEGEMVYQNNNWSNSNISHAIYIPKNSAPGTTRMRVRLSTSNNLYSNDADHILEGETEDYLIQIGTGSSNLSYAWTSDPIGFTSNDLNAVIHGSIDTTYYLTVTDSVTGCIKTTSILVDSAQTMPVISGDQIWYAYAFNGFDYDNYEGFYTESKLNFVSTDKWANGGTPSDYTGYSGCTVDANLHSMKYKRQGFDCGVYSLSIPGHDDNCYLYVNDSLVFFHDDCCDSHNDIWTGYLDASSKVEFAWKNGGGGSYGALSFNLISHAPSLGTISGTVAFCEGLVPTNQTYTVVANPDILAYEWSVPDGASIVNGNGTNTVEVNYSANNISGQISVYGISDCGAGLPSLATIVMDLYPDSTISVSGPIAFCSGGDVDLTAGVADSYLWSNGETTASINVTTYGDYTVTLTNGGGCAKTSSTINVYVPELPSATLSQTADCNGNTIGLSAGLNTSTYPVSYSWTSTPAGFISNDQVPSITPSTDTTYYLSVIDTILGCSKNTSMSFDSTDLMPEAYGNQIWNVYAYNGYNYDTYQGFYTESNLNFNSIERWGDGDSPSYYSGYSGCAVTQDNHSVIYKRKGFPCGTYQLNIPNHDDDCQVYVDNQLIFQHSGCCDSHTNIWTGHLDANSKIMFAWQEGGGGSLGALSFNLLSSIAELGTIDGTTTLCGNVTDQTYSVQAVSGVTDYVWSVPSGASIVSGNGSEEILVSYAPNFTPGTISVYGINDCGAGITSTLNIMTSPLPNSNINSNGPTTFCSGSNVTLQADTSSGNSYLWSTGETTSSIEVNSEDTYSVLITNTSGCEADGTVDVIVNAIPSVTLVPLGMLCSNSGIFTLTGGSPSGGVYSGTSVTNGLFDPTIGTGIYTITYTYSDGNGCESSDSNEITVDICAGLGFAENATGSIKVYPNPAHGILNINFPAATEATVELLDATGKMILQKEIKVKHILNEQINIAEYAEGIYLLRIKQEGAVHNYRMAVN